MKPGKDEDFLPGKAESEFVDFRVFIHAKRDVKTDTEAGILPSG
jgi:hypothetical protein